MPKLKKKELHSRTLSSVAEVVTGSPSHKKFANTGLGPVYMLQTGSVSSPDTVFWDRAPRVAPEKNYERFLLENDDILFVSLGSKYYNVLVRDVGGREAIPASHFFRIRIDNPDEIIPDFLAWQLNLPRVREYCLSQAVGSAQLSLRISVVRDLPVFLPSRERQEELVRAVRLGQEKIALMQEGIAVQQAMLDAIGEHICR